MSDEQSSDDQIGKILSEAEGGLWGSGTPQATDGDRTPMRSEPGGESRLPRGPRKRADSAPRWLAPAGAVAVIALVIGILMFVSQGDRLKALERKVAALHGGSELAGSVDDLRSRMQQLDSRIEDLATRVGQTNTGDADIKAVRQLVADQGAQIKSLSQRLEQLEHKRKTPGSAAVGESAPAQAQASKPASSGSWVVNLISVADVASAKRFEQRLRDMGVQSRLDEVDIGGKSLKRVVATGFTSKDEARKFAAKARKQLSLPAEPWISQD
jgi:cell division septation protein DedD